MSITGIPDKIIQNFYSRSSGDRKGKQRASGKDTRDHGDKPDRESAKQPREEEALIET